MSALDLSHEHWEELAAGWALHALEPDEEQLFVAHVASCEQCRRVADENAFVAAQLGSLADHPDQEAPSWAKIRAGIVRAPVVPIASRRRAPRLLAAAASVAVLAGIGVAAADLVGSSPSAGSAAIANCRKLPTCQVIALQSSGSKTARADVLVTGDTATVVPTSLSDAPGGHMYVLWQLPRAGGPRALGSFRGKTTTPLAVPDADTAAFAISLEPAGVTPTQPTDILAVGAASA